MTVGRWMNAYQTLVVGPKRPPFYYKSLLNWRASNMLKSYEAMMYPNYRLRVRDAYQFDPDLDNTYFSIWRNLKIDTAMYLYSARTLSKRMKE